MPRGGKREGAGRKLLDDVERESISATLSVELVKLLHSASVASGRSRARLVHECVAACAATLQAIAAGSDVRLDGVTQDYIGVPGAGRKRKERQATVRIPAVIDTLLPLAARRTRSSEAALLDAGLYQMKHWLEVIGLPTIEAAPPELEKVWRAVAAEGEAVVFSGPGGARALRPRPLPADILNQFVARTVTHPGVGPVCIVRNIRGGTWLVGDHEGAPIGCYIGVHDVSQEGDR